MNTPEPTPLHPLHPLTFAERFWAQARGPETDDVPEPLRSVTIVRQFLAALDRLDATSPRKAAAAMVAMLRQAELEGDLSYASPEQVRGEILDTRSVVFSLGVVLFERLTGRHPFGAENNRPRRIDRIRKGELGSGVNSFPTVAAGLRSVLVRAMSPFPEERWPDLRQMRELLGAFMTQESPQPRLPGTQSETSAEDTRVVRMATDFGRELMQVVARHDRVPTGQLGELPRTDRDLPRGAGPRTSQRLAVPTAGLGTITGAGATPVRRPSQATPRGGVVHLLPPTTTSSGEPTSDSVVTRIHTGAHEVPSPPAVDPHGETAQVLVDDLEIAQRIDDALREVSQPAIAPAPPVTAPPPIAAPPPPPAPPPVAAAAPPPARRVPRAPVSAAAAARVAAAASVPPLTAVIPPPPPAAPPDVAFAPRVELPSIAEPIPIVDLRPSAPPRRTAMVAVISAALGGIVAIALFVSLRSDPSPAAASSTSAAAPDDPSARSAPVPPAAADPAPTADPAPVAPVEPVAPPPVLTLEAAVAAAITPCVTAATHTRNRLFGLSVLYRYGVVAKPYFASNDALTTTERGCIGKTLKGRTIPGAPHEGMGEYKVRVDAAGVHVGQRAK